MAVSPLQAGEYGFGAEHVEKCKALVIERGLVERHG
jgi:hypothetical protein